MDAINSTNIVDSTEKDYYSKVINTIPINVSIKTGIDIATAKAIESVMSDTYKSYKYYINVATMVRNTINSINLPPADKLSTLKSKSKQNKIMEYVIHTMEDIKNLLSEINICYYIADYRILIDAGIYIKQSESGGVKGYVGKIVESITDAIKSKNIVTVYSANKIEQSDNSLITTHVGLDLLNFKFRENVYLIESHTGEIKDKSRWNTKYNKIAKKSMDIFPFNELLYRILGDGTFVRPIDKDLRRMIYDIGLKYKWNYLTSQSKVYSDILEFSPKEFKTLLSKIKYYYPRK